MNKLKITELLEEAMNSVYATAYSSIGINEIEKNDEGEATKIHFSGHVFSLDQIVDDVFVKLSDIEENFETEDLDKLIQINKDDMDEYDVQAVFKTFCGAIQSTAGHGYYFHTNPSDEVITNNALCVISDTVDDGLSIEQSISEFYNKIENTDENTDKFEEIRQVGIKLENEVGTDKAMEILWKHSDDFETIQEFVSRIENEIESVSPKQTKRTKCTM